MVKKGSLSENKSFLSRFEPVNSKVMLSLWPMCEIQFISYCEINNCLFTRVLLSINGHHSHVTQRLAVRNDSTFKSSFGWQNLGQTAFHRSKGFLLESIASVFAPIEHRKLQELKKNWNCLVSFWSIFGKNLSHFWSYYWFFCQNIQENQSQLNFRNF